MHIRPFERRDTDPVIGLWQARGLARPWNDPLKDIERKLALQPELFLVGELDGTIVATAMGATMAIAARSTTSPPRRHTPAVDLAPRSSPNWSAA